MKNITTPRTLAECQFTTGYRSAAMPRRFAWSDLVYGAVCFGAFAAVGVLLALGV